MKECLFCNILKEKNDYYKFWENNYCSVFIDLNINNKEIALIISKKHMENENLTKKYNDEIIKSLNKITDLLQKNLNLKRLLIDSQVPKTDHVHIKVYPLKENKFISEYVDKKSIIKKIKENSSKMIKTTI
jgi:diadenosine tetraphosphate (Ap4A) HIT family hydrolase